MQGNPTFFLLLRRERPRVQRRDCGLAPRLVRLDGGWRVFGSLDFEFLFTLVRSEGDGGAVLATASVGQRSTGAVSLKPDEALAASSAAARICELVGQRSSDEPLSGVLRVEVTALSATRIRVRALGMGCSADIALDGEQAEDLGRLIEQLVQLLAGASSRSEVEQPN